MLSSFSHDRKINTQLHINIIISVKRFFLLSKTTDHFVLNPVSDLWKHEQHVIQLSMRDYSNTTQHARL